MDFLNQINKVGTQFVDSLNEKATSALDALNQAVVDNVDNAKQFGGKVLRKAGQKISPIPAVVETIPTVKQYVKEIPDKGIIPVLPTAISPEARTATGYIKSMMGEVGRPIRILDNPQSSAFYQQTIDEASYNPSNRTLTFNENIEDQDAYEELGTSYSNKDFGRYNAKVDKDGNVILSPNESYGTNDPADLHGYRVFEGKNNPDDQEPIGPTQRAISGLAGAHRILEDAGWTNPRPFGTNLKIGEYK